MGSYLPFVSVIIPVLNEERTIRECLASLIKMDYPPERREILVVDNGSTDQTAEIVQSFPVTLLREERRGASYARNRGIEASKGEILAFTDADCVVTTSWLRELGDGFSSDDVGVVAGEVVAYPPKTPSERYVARRRPLFQWHCLHDPGSPPGFAISNVAFRRTVFDAIGLFDPQLPSYEDTDLSWRFLRVTNLRLVYRPKALVFHHHEATRKALFMQYRRYGYAQALLRRKYPKEVAWDWRRELRANGDLVRSVLGFGLEAIRTTLAGQGMCRLSDASCDLVRSLGARIGFIHGTLRRGE